MIIDNESVKHMPADDYLGSDLPAILDATRISALRLLEQARVQPQSLRVTAGPITVEMDWTPETREPSARVATLETAAAATEVTVPDSGNVHAPAVGVFYRAPEPGAAPFAEPDDVVVPGQKLGLIEVMKLMIPVEASLHGRVIEFLQPDGAPVEYGTPLAVILPIEGQ